MVCWIWLNRWFYILQGTVYGVCLVCSCRICKSRLQILITEVLLKTHQSVSLLFHRYSCHHPPSLLGWQSFCFCLASLDTILPSFPRFETGVSKPQWINSFFFLDNRIKTHLSWSYQEMSPFHCSAVYILQSNSVRLVCKYHSTINVPDTLLGI